MAEAPWLAAQAHPKVEECLDGNTMAQMGRQGGAREGAFATVSPLGAAQVPSVTLHVSPTACLFPSP